MLMVMYIMCFRVEEAEYGLAFAAAILPYCAFFPVSLLVLAFSTAATGTCIVCSGCAAAHFQTTDCLIGVYLHKLSERTTSLRCAHFDTTLGASY